MKPFAICNLGLWNQKFGPIINGHPSAKIHGHEMGALHTIIRFLELLFFMKLDRTCTTK